MYSGYALYISVTIFCNSLPLKTYAAKTCESLGKIKNSGRSISLMTFEISLIVKECHQCIFYIIVLSLNSRGHLDSQLVT